MSVADDDNVVPFPPAGNEPPGDYELLTQHRCAIQFAERFAGQLAFCHDEGVWRQYDGSIWRTVKTPLAFHYAREMAVAMQRRYPKTGVVEVHKTSFPLGVERFAKSDPVFARTSEHWDPDPWLLGTPAGTVDLKTGRLRPAEPGDNITKSTAIPPGATYASAPLWENFLDQACGGEPELVEFLQQIAGYALTGLTHEHALFFVYGPGGNGKSVFLNTLAHVLGDYATTAAMDTFTASSRSGQIPADLAMLRGARLVTASETSEGKKWDQQRVAQVTGGDPITARFMRENFFTYKPQFTLIIVGNHKPTLTSVDDAMRRRFNIIPFLIRPERPDRHLEEKLVDEWPAILRWAIDGCLDWQERGLVRPPVVTEATSEYFDEQNTLAQWLEQDCEVDFKNWHLADLSSALFASWSSYCRANGEDAGTSKTFKPAMEKHGFRFKKTAEGRWFHYVRLKPRRGDGD